MADYKIVNADQLDADLSTVADAIRKMGATEEQIDFPNGFANEVDRLTNMLIGLIERKADTIFTFPKGLTSIARYSFDQSVEIYFPEVFPEGIKSIGYYAFHNCSKFTKLVLPASLETLENWAFVTCANLTTVTFKSTPSIAGNPFDQCTSLTTINVPWAEGEVSGAPWGATNATVNYSYIAEE